MWEPIAHELGHLDQEWQNLRRARIFLIPDLKETNFIPDALPPQETNKSFQCYAAVISAPEKRMTYSDQTGHFPYQSSRGNKYIFVMYNYDANAFLFDLLKDRSAASLVEA